MTKSSDFTLVTSSSIHKHISYAKDISNKLLKIRFIIPNSIKSDLGELERTLGSIEGQIYVELSQYNNLRPALCGFYNLIILHIQTARNQVSKVPDIIGNEPDLAHKYLEKLANNTQRDYGLICSNIKLLKMPDIGGRNLPILLERLHRLIKELKTIKKSDIENGKVICNEIATTYTEIETALAEKLSIII